jgi:hypothetical protein
MVQKAALAANGRGRAKHSASWLASFLSSINFHLSNNMDFPSIVKGITTKRRHDFSLVCIVALLLPAAAWTDEVENAPFFVAQTADGAMSKGGLRELKAGWSLRLGEGDGRRIAGEKLVALRRLDVPLPPMPMDRHLILANGDRIPFQKLRLFEEKFYLRHPHLQEGKETSVPLAAVAVLWCGAPEKVLDAEKLRRRLTLAQRTRDTVCLRNGDLVTGTVASLSDGKIVVEEERRRPVTVKMEQLAYVAFNTELAEVLRPKKTYARVVLIEGRPGSDGRLSLTSASADETTLRGTTVFGARLSVPLKRVAALDVHRGCCVYLSDLKESKYLFTPFLDARWPFAADGNVAEHDLLLNGSTYDKGIGLHSRSQLSYRLDGAYRRFEALVGLDDKDGRSGDARIRVLADGVARLDRALTRRDGAVPIAVKVAGVRELTLEVDFGGGGDVQDVVDWADARLIK